MQLRLTILDDDLDLEPLLFLRIGRQRTIGGEHCERQQQPAGNVANIQWIVQTMRKEPILTTVDGYGQGTIRRFLKAVQENPGTRFHPRPFA
ncbi:hypothetical protein [Arenimonas sp.]|uniref:hypothetical protein n=1 Tax=Arenimonas sp. TaxID=1872635 RepID=UPI0039E61A42